MEFRQIVGSSRKLLVNSNEPERLYCWTLYRQLVMVVFFLVIWMILTRKTPYRSSPFKLGMQTTVTIGFRTINSRISVILQHGQKINWRKNNIKNTKISACGLFSIAHQVDVGFQDVRHTLILPPMELFADYLTNNTLFACNYAFQST